MKAVFLVLLLILGGPAVAGDKQNSPPAKSEAQCGKGADRRYAVCRGAWSSKTVSLFNTWTAIESNPERVLRLYSPDLRKLLLVNGSRTRLRIEGHTFWTPFGAMHDAEVSWSPDSSRIFVTWSESGELGPWRTQIYSVDESGLHEFRGIVNVARRDFEKRVRTFPVPKELRTVEGRQYWAGQGYCEPYHVIGSQWMNGSEELLVSVLVRNTGDCRYSSEFNVYRIKAAIGEILERFTARDAHAKFGGDDLPIITE